METPSVCVQALGLAADKWQRCAREAAAAFGDVAVVTRVLPGAQVIEVVAVSHRDPARELVAQRVLGERYRRGESLPGRVWQAERGILLVDVDSAALAGLALEDSRRYVREVGLRSMIIVPLWEGGRVVGTLGVARDSGGPPYLEDDLERLTSMAVLDD